MQAKFPFPEGVQPLSIGTLTNEIKGILEKQYASVWVEGEVSNLSRPQSGHIYLTLKDAQAQLKAVIYRGIALRMRFDLRDGMEIFARGRISIYAPQGQYQLSIEECYPKGLGAAELALRQLKEKLFAKGYFEPNRKRRLPRYPRSIALVTSPTGAAVRDMLEIFAKRWPLARITVCPVRVQGEGSAQEIATAIRMLNRALAEGTIAIDAMIVGRGGGSLEDLWPFNEEIVADAIFTSRIPVVSAVGHEIDLTIADLVADYRGLTPSQAATSLTPDIREVAAALTDARRQLDDTIRNRLAFARQRLAALSERRALRLPLERIRDGERKLDDLSDRLRRAGLLKVDRLRDRLAAVAGQLQTLSPLNVLSRGYSLTRKEDSTEFVRDALQVVPGDRLVTTVSHGKIVSRVEEVQAE